jgi:hypothetical protein
MVWRGWWADQLIEIEQVRLVERGEVGSLCMYKHYIIYGFLLLLARKAASIGHRERLGCIPPPISRRPKPGARHHEMILYQ